MASFETGFSSSSRLIWPTVGSVLRSAGCDLRRPRSSSGGWPPSCPAAASFSGPVGRGQVDLGRVERAGREARLQVVDGPGRLGVLREAGAEVVVGLEPEHAGGRATTSSRRRPRRPAPAGGRRGGRAGAKMVALGLPLPGLDGQKTYRPEQGHDRRDQGERGDRHDRDGDRPGRAEGAEEAERGEQQHEERDDDRAGGGGDDLADPLDRGRPSRSSCRRRPAAVPGSGRAGTGCSRCRCRTARGQQDRLQVLVDLEVEQPCPRPRPATGPGEDQRRRRRSAAAPRSGCGR